MYSYEVYVVPGRLSVYLERPMCTVFFYVPLFRVFAMTNPFICANSTTIIYFSNPRWSIAVVHCFISPIFALKSPIIINLLH